MSIRSIQQKQEEYVHVHMYVHIYIYIYPEIGGAVVQLDRLVQENENILREIFSFDSIIVFLSYLHQIESKMSR
jgi:hypothetical protein